MKTSIDVVIPTYRVQEKYLASILQLCSPASVSVRVYLLIDNVEIAIPEFIQSLVNEKDILVIWNEKNIGAAESRNRGIEMGVGEWILFLDDDITVKKELLEIYAAAINQYPDETGFIGLVLLPPPASAFTKAIMASGSMDIFGIAANKKSHAWGATANIMISRQAIGGTRFSDKYPKSGGGEDVDFFLRVREQNNYSNFKCLPEASVTHPWWNEEKVNFRRPFRYGLGNSWLGQLNPRYTYRDFLNTPETLLITSTVFIVVLLLRPSGLPALLCFLAGVLMIEVLAGSIQLIKRTKGKINFLMIMYNVALRFVYESGLLYGNLKRGRFLRIGERFHYDGSIDKGAFYRLNTHKTVKWLLYPLLIYVCFKIYSS